MIAIHYGHRRKGSLPSEGLSTGIYKSCFMYKEGAMTSFLRFFHRNYPDNILVSTHVKEDENDY